MQVLASLEHVDAMNKAWEKCINFRKIDYDVVRPVIARSWERCLAYGVDPYRETGLDLLTFSELQARRARRSDLIRVAIPFMKMLMDTCGDDFLVMLADEDGYTLQLLSDPAQMEYVDRHNMGEGSNYGEKAVGTNTLGIVLEERVPVQVLAKEHYRYKFHEWSSSASPIFDERGNLLGGLHCSGHYTKVHPHSLGMVIAAVKAIENQLHLETVNGELKAAHEYSKTIMESITEGLITINQKGIITWINAAGGRIMGVEPSTRIGRPLGELGSAVIPMQQALYSDGFSDRETVMENEQGRFHFTMTTQPIRNEEGEAVGAVATLREIKTVRRLVTNMLGAQARFTFDELIGASEVFQKALFLAHQAASSTSTILLQGESGTGKELFAQAIHNGSKRAKGAFIAVNCAAIPRDLIGSELFGYEDGAFTGARRGGCPGKFELASGGTVFLDEIGDMPLDLQVTLLRVLQVKQVTRLGGRKVIPVDVRVIAATHRNLKSEIKKGRFREDLYYRLNIFTLDIPSLRERRGDVEELVRHFVAKIGAELGKPRLQVEPDAMAILVEYPWPGNVRELENTIERAVNVTLGDRITAEELPDTLTEKGGRAVRRGCGPSPTLEEVERQAIVDALAVNGNVAQAARALGLARSTMYKKIERYEIEI